jgi:Zn-dependent protease with chaperone function
MSALAAGLGLSALMVALPLLTRARSGVSPRVAAGSYLVILVGWALLPVVWLACLGAAGGSCVAGIRMSGGGCLLGWDREDWLLVGFVPAAALLGILGWRAVTIAAAARRAELRGPALAGAVPLPTGGGCVWVVPSPVPVAFAAGLWRPRAVVTSGLLNPLNEEERRAVCAHEAAHVRLGHPRILLVGGAVAAAFRRWPPVCRAWEALRRELEAAADDEAAREVGRDPLLSALARVALAGGVASEAAGFGDAEHLRYRILRLQDPQPVRLGPTLAVGSSTTALAAMMAWSACALVGAPSAGMGVVACLCGIGVVGLRPMWGWRRTRG